MRAGWALFVVVLTAGLACRAVPPRVTPSHDAQIVAPSSPGSPFEPTSPEPAQRQLAPFVVEVLSALVLAAAGTGTIIAAVDDGDGPRHAHERRIDRPPIPPRSPS